MNPVSDEEDVWVQLEVTRAKERGRVLITLGLIGMLILGWLKSLDYQPRTVGFVGAPVYVGNGAGDPYYTSQRVTYTYTYTEPPSPLKNAVNIGVGLIEAWS